MATGHRVLVKVLGVEEDVCTDSGIIIKAKADSYNDRSCSKYAKVVQVGANAFKAFDDGHPWCKVGDEVLIAEYSGVLIPEEDGNSLYRIINDEDVLGVVVYE